jgi:putative ABC transport system permease protein
MINIFKDIFKTIRAKKALYLMVYIQLVLTLFTVILSSSNIGYLIDYKSGVEKYTKENWAKPKVIDVSNLSSLIQNNIDIINNWYNYMISRKEIQNVGDVSLHADFNYDGSVVDESKSSDNNKTIQVCTVNKMFLDNYNNDIETGEKISSKTKYSEKNVPALISNDLKSKFKIGDILNNMYRVVGVLKPKVEIPLNSEFETLTTKENKFIICPLIETSAFKNMYYYDLDVQDCIVELKNINDYKSFKDAVDKKADELGLPFRITEPKSSMNQRIKDELLVELPDLCVTVVMILLSVVGNIAVYLSIILRKKREFGIRLALGASIENLCKSIVTEVALLIITSLMIAACIHYILYRIINLNSANHVFILPSTGITTISIIALITVIMIFIISIIPILKVKELQPSELIREVK